MMLRARCLTSPGETPARARAKGGRHNATTRMGMRLAIGGLLACCTAAIPACGMIKAAIIAGAPQTKKVPAEFDRLEGRKVVIHVWTPIEIAWDYPKARLDLAAYLGGYLEENVKDITVADPIRVEAYLEKHNSFDLKPEDVGREFQADMVVYLAVYQHTMRDAGMAHFYRGRVGSSVMVYDLTQGDKAEQVPLKEVLAVYPEETASGFANVRPEDVRQATYGVFTAEVGKKFHEHEIPID